ncbi:hypothetical protein CRYUN_Cryun12cG0067900 [Craigia yunnanensis]
MHLYPSCSKEAAADSMVYSYKHGFSGFAAKLTESQAQKISELPGVIHVMPNRFHSLQTTRTWDYLDISSHSPFNLLHDTNMGDGIIIGLLDTGVWPESKVFNDEGLGPIPARWKGHCESGQLFNGTTDCNRKLIGAKYFIDGFLAENNQPFNTTDNPDYMSPKDSFGHGTHTSTIAGGSFVANASYKCLALGTARGGAPRAHIAMYKPYMMELMCYHCHSALKFPFEEVDGRDGIAIGSFHAVANGIPVVCSAANDGPAAHTVHNTSPWIITVAATTLDRSFPTPIILGNNVTILGQAWYAGKDIGFTRLVYPENPGLRPALAGVCESLSFNHTSVDGKVVLCFTTVTRRSAVTSAVSAVRAAGGVGVIVAKNPGDVMWSRLPMRCVAAPGVSLLAASSALDPFMDGGFALHSGTSMAAPVISGIIAFLKVKHPNWSPAAIKSAIVTTAWKIDPFGEPIFAEGSPRKLADPFDFGGGLANPNKAAKPLVGQAIACPSTKPSVLDVNLPSITIPNLRNSATLTGRVTNVGPPNSTYRVLVEPPFGIAITVAPDMLFFHSTAQKISFQVTVYTSHQVNTGYYFGSLTWTDGVHNVTIPISARTQILQNYADEN